MPAFAGMTVLWIAFGECSLRLCGEKFRDDQET
jgi:hypothetical protein